MPLKNFSWVLPGKLAGSDIPGRGSDLEEDIQQLSSEGIKYLVSLEKPSGEVRLLCRQSGMEWNYFPILDFNIPQDTKSFGKLISKIISKFDSGKPVCVHCHAGVGRTGLVLSCVVGKYFGISAGKAIGTVRKSRRAIDTPGTGKIVQEFLETQP
jgi:atypical dual specificity phosphatase